MKRISRNGKLLIVETRGWVHGYPLKNAFNVSICLKFFMVKSSEKKIRTNNIFQQHGEFKIKTRLNSYTINTITALEK